MAKMNTCFVQCVCLNIGARDTPVKENQIPCTKIGPTQCNVLVTHFFLAKLEIVIGIFLSPFAS